MAIDADAVVAAAVAILDEYGMADLSMRRVADALGVKAGALYWHVANKQTLLALVADEVLREVPSTVGPPASAMVDWARGLRAVLLRHRDSAELVATALATGLCRVDVLAPAEALLSGSGAVHPRWGAQAVLHLVLGHVGQEQDERLFADLGVLPDPPDAAASEQAFDHAVGALVDGLLVRSSE